jgi:hypothetical protein
MLFLQISAASVSAGIPAHLACDGHHLLEHDRCLQEVAVLLRRLQVWVVLQAANHAHHMLLLQQLIQQLQNPKHSSQRPQSASMYVNTLRITCSSFSSSSSSCRAATERMQQAQDRHDEPNVRTTLSMDHTAACAAGVLSADCAVPKQRG